MKNLFAGLFVAFLIAPAFSLDTWDETKYESGEAVYYSQGPVPTMILGNRGIAVMYTQFFTGKAIMEEESKISIDEKAIPVELIAYPASAGGLYMFMLKDGQSLIPLIANAKKIELDTRQCGGACGMTKTGGTYKKLTWEFETTLAEQYKDYQERIR